MCIFNHKSINQSRKQYIKNVQQKNVCPGEWDWRNSWPTPRSQTPQLCSTYTRSGISVLSGGSGTWKWDQLWVGLKTKIWAKNWFNKRKIILRITRFLCNFLALIESYTKRIFFLIEVLFLGNLANAVLKLKGLFTNFTKLHSRFGCQWILNIKVLCKLALCVGYTAYSSERVSLPHYQNSLNYTVTHLYRMPFFMRLIY